MNITEIARTLGYSVSVVSRALNPSPDKSSTVSPRTRAKIQAAAAQLDFTRNQAASCVRRRKNPAIGIFMPGFCRSMICDALNGMATVAAEQNLALNLYFGGSADLAQFMRKVTRQENIGIIVYYHASRQDQPNFTRLLKDFCAKGGKVVLFNTDAPDGRFHEEMAKGKMVVIKFDDADGGRQAADYLQTRGCRSFLALSFPSVYYETRTRAFCEHLAGQGIQAACEHLHMPTADIHADRALLRQALLKHLDDPDLGLFVPSDYHMLDVLAIMQSLGRVPGRDYQLVAYDKCDFLTHVNQNLASLEQNFQFAGQRAMQMLTAMLNCEPVSSEWLKTRMAVFTAD